MLFAAIVEGTILTAFYKLPNNLNSDIKIKMHGLMTEEDHKSYLERDY